MKIYTIYSGNRCQWCEMAKGLLKAKNIDFIEINIDKSPEAKERLLNLGYRTIPVLLLEDECIGAGYEAIEAWTKRV